MIDAEKTDSEQTTSTGKGKTRKRRKRQNRDVEEEYLRLAEYGDSWRLRHFLKKHEDIDVDCLDILGRSALRLAVGNEHLQVVAILLEICSLRHIYDALLLAISLDIHPITEAIIRHPKYEQSRKANYRRSGSFYEDHAFDDTLVSSDTTPLTLAAERNQYHIVKLLLMKGESIEEPHDYYCDCQECQTLDQLRVAKSRLNTYRGLASEAYVAMSSADPILTSFQLGRKLRHIANIEKYYKNEYKRLANSLSTFVVKLLDRVRGGQELDVILNENAGFTPERYEKLARLKLAIHFQEKKFVAHAICQKKLTSIWYADLRFIERPNMFWTVILACLFVTIYPFLAVVYWINPWSKVGQFLRIPYIKFLASAISYIVFLLMVIAYSSTEDPSAGYKLSEHPDVGPLYKNYLNECYANNNSVLLNDVYVRYHKIGYGSVIICIWILGMIWTDCKQIYTEKLNHYLDNRENILDLCMQALYVTSFTLRFLSVAKVRWALSFFSTSESWRLPLTGRCCPLEQAYWLDADRFYWKLWDPCHISEALFALANVLSFIRLMVLFVISEHFGPLQISLVRMIKDVGKFLMLFLLLCVAFIVGFHNLYWYYNPQERRKAETTNHGDANGGVTFGYFPGIISTLYWNIFGMAEVSSVELGVYGTTVTSVVGTVMFAFYTWGTVIVLINMLIAMMARSYEAIAADRMVEWKFERTKLYMDYIKEGATLPVPFNIMPTWKSIYFLLKNWIVCCYPCLGKNNPDDSIAAKRKNRFDESMTYENSLRVPGYTSREKGTNDVIKISPMDPSTNIQTESGLPEGHESTTESEDLYQRNIPEPLTKYEIVMRRVIQRYLCRGSQDAVPQEVPGVSDDTEKIKQDISSFRCEVLHVLESHEINRDTFSARIDTLEKEINSANTKLTQILEDLNSPRRTMPQRRKFMTNDQYFTDLTSLPSSEISLPISMPPSIGRSSENHSQNKESFTRCFGDYRGEFILQKTTDDIFVSKVNVQHDLKTTIKQRTLLQNIGQPEKLFDSSNI